MKKLIIGLAAAGVVMALRPLVKRRMVQKMHEHCKQMMGDFEDRGAAAGHEATGPEAMRQTMREHCEQMATQHEEQNAPLATA